MRIVLAEDQALLRGALIALFQLEADITVVGDASDGVHALKLVRALQPDILLTDIEMPGLSGLDVAAALKSEASPTRVVIVTTFARTGYLRRALDAGVRGYLLKEMPVEKLSAALRDVYAGARVVAPELALDAWAGETDPLSERERAVLRLAGEGLTTNAIGLQMHLSGGTVRNYLSEAIGKLNASNRVEAYRLARQQGWL